LANADLLAPTRFRREEVYEGRERRVGGTSSPLFQPLLSRRGREGRGQFGKKGPRRVRRLYK